jgi:hypothetical protein
MKIDKNTPFADFVFYADLFRLAENQVGQFFKKLEKKRLPASIAGSPVPGDLNDLTFGQLIQLQSVSKAEDMLFIPMQILLNIKKKDILKLKAFDVIRFMLFTKKELIRIGKLFADIRYRPNADEINAGINNINNGLFGTIDWYARRMGITNHEEVEKIPWLRIYKCLEMDNKQALYEKRLREIISKKKQ